MIKRTLATFQNISGKTLNAGDINRTLLLRQDFSMTIFGTEYTNPFGIPEYRNIGIVRGKQELSGQFGSPQFRHDPLRDKSIIQVILGLVQNQRVLIIQQQ